MSMLPQPPGRSDLRPRSGGPANLAEILERVLDKGIVIAGDIQINLLDIELLTIRLRLLVCSVDRAQEMGINWWESDPNLNSNAKRLAGENRELKERVERLERLLGTGPGASTSARADAALKEGATDVETDTVVVVEETATTPAKPRRR